MEVHAETDLHALLATLLELERSLGRDRAHELRFGPRPIDLDILVAAHRVIDSPELVVPHPRLAERRFALLPLVDLVGESWCMPDGGASVGALLRQASAQSVELVSDEW